MKYLNENLTEKDLKEFAERVKKAAEAVYGNNSNVRIEKVNKNNETSRTALVIISHGKTCSPSIYLENYLNRHFLGESFDELCREIFDLYEQAKDVKESGMHTTVQDICNYNKVKDRICMKLVNAEKNRNLPNIPCDEFSDLQTVFYILLDKNVSTMTITHEIMNMWEVSVCDLYKAAVKNTPKMLKGIVASLQHLYMQEITGGFHSSFGLSDSDEEYTIKKEKDLMYVATNETKCFGASVIFYKNLLADFADVIGDDFYILPSSVHEVIFVPAASFPGGSIDLKNLVKEINCTEVSEDETLSNNIYFYSRRFQNIEML